jgi:proline iminopeptidase
MVYGALHPGHASGLVLASTMARFDLGRLVEGFRRAGGDEVAAIAERAYGGDPASVTPEEWARCFAAFGPHVPTDEEQARKLVNEALRGPGFALLRTFDAVERLATVDCPTLVLVGDLDPVTPVAAAEEIAAALPVGVARLELLEGAGHFAWKDVPDRYFALLAEFAGR